MRKREIVWEDPRFRKKKDQPKPLKINRLGEAPCVLPPAHVPAYADPSIPSGMTAPPCPRPAAAAGRSGPQRAATCRRPPAAMARGSGFQCPPPARPSSGMTVRPPSVTAPVVVATRPPPLAPHGGARPKQMMYRPGTALPQRPCPQPQSASPCPPRSSMYTSRLPSASPCPAPCPAPCPPSPCPAPCPSSPTRRQPSPPCPPQQSSRFSGLPRSSGLRPPMAGRSGLRPPTATHATTIVARRHRSPEPCPPPPCAPEPCPPDPCQPDPCPPDPCPGESRSMAAPCPQVSTPQPRRSAFRGGLRPPSRLMAPGSFSRPQPKPQKIVLLPGDINPHETTVITVEPPPQPDPCRPRSPQASSGWQNLMSVPFDLSPPSMDVYRRESGGGLPPAPYIPPEIMARAEAAAEACPETPSELETPQYETSSALLVDVEPFDPCTMESKVVIEPVDLITFPANDPFSPERPLRPPSPSVTPPPCPFTPPKDPLPERSELDKWADQYPRYNQAYTSSFHPISEWAKIKHQQKLVERERQVKYVDRELVARSVPFNKNVSTICKDDDDYDDEILHYMPDVEENFNAPLDYAALRRQEEIERQEREARRRERERQEKGPSLAETRQMLARVREAECARRAEIASNVLSDYRPPTMTQEEMRSIHDRVIARHAGQLQQQQQSSDISCLDAAPCEFLDDVQLDECDLDAFDAMDECLDF